MTGTSPSNPYFGLRDLVFGAKLPGFAMDTAFADFSFTLVALEDGSVSLYLSNGGGIIGAGSHEGPQRVSKELLGLAPQYENEFVATAHWPLPAPGRTKVYLLSEGGVRVAEAPDEDLGEQRHPLSPLFYKAHELIAEVRNIEGGSA